MMVWVAIAVTAAGCYAWRALGMSVPPRLLDRPAVRRFAVLAPVALLAALTGVQTLATGRSVAVDARVGGLAAAAVLLLLRAPFLVVVGAAVAVTAALRLLGWG
jgi:hypothetical protein